MKILALDLYIAEEDCLTARRDCEVYRKLQELNHRVNKSFYDARSLYSKRSNEQEMVEETLDYCLSEDDIEAKAFYQSRKVQLDILVRELSEEVEQAKTKMKTEYIELTEEEFQVFTQVNDWSFKRGENRTEYSRNLRAAQSNA